MPIHPQFKLQPKALTLFLRLRLCPLAPQPKGGAFTGNDKDFFRFRLGSGEVIPGFEEAVAGMKVRALQQRRFMGEWPGAAALCRSMRMCRAAGAGGAASELLRVPCACCG